MTMLDAGPLLDTIDRRGGLTAVLHSQGVAGESVAGHRWRDSLRRVRRNGYVSPWLADRICVRLLGTLPSLVYGQEWWDAIPDDEGEVA